MHPFSFDNKPFPTGSFYGLYDVAKGKAYLAALIPDLKETVPRACGHCHSIISNTQAANTVIMACQDTCNKWISTQNVVYRPTVPFDNQGQFREDEVLKTQLGQTEFKLTHGALLSFTQPNHGNKDRCVTHNV